MLTFMLLAFGLLGASGEASAAFGGCVVSPENPTLILGALGGAAAVLPWLRAQFRRRG